jgi:hypothetical protein
LKAAPLLETDRLLAAGFAPPIVYAKAKLVGVTAMVGAAGGAVTVMFCWRVPVPPPNPFTPAAQNVTAVLEVTVGAVQVNVQLPVLLGELCTSSPPEILPPAPAVRVPADVARSMP